MPREALTSSGEVTVAQNVTATLPDGRPVTNWTIASPRGVSAEVLALGARLQALYAPDRNGVPANVVLGCDGLEDLFGEAVYLGATVGRYANRIAGGQFPLDGATYRVTAPPGGHALHGGTDGFASRLWDGVAVREGRRAGVRLRLHSPDGDQGFPGALTVEVTYLLDPAGELWIGYSATTDAPTVVNLTNHAYVNLAGEGNGTVLDHLLRVEAGGYLPVDSGLIPVGPVAPVDGTPFDLREARRIGNRFVEGNRQIQRAGTGFDHNWVLDGEGFRQVATLSHPASGRRLDCLTTEPGIQVYTGNHFDGTLAGRSGRPYGAYAGVALETQHFPDSPNRPEYPSTVLRPGEEFRSMTVYRFSAE